MKAVIIDDERLARAEVRRLLVDFDWVKVVGEKTKQIHLKGTNSTEIAEKIEYGAGVEPAVVMIE